MARRSGPSTGLIIVSLLVLGAWLWWGSQVPPANDRPPSNERHSDSPSRDASPRATGQASGQDPDSGLDWVSESELTPEGRETLALIDAGGPYPYSEDDGTFGNFEGVLPAHSSGYYREYTVVTPGLSHRGARRIIAGDGGELYWTTDHYESFRRIQR